jgi:thioesterase domain-containing protein
LILAHPLGGNLLCYGPLIRNLPEGVAVFGVQATKETGRLEASSIDSLAAAYVAEIDAPGPIGVAGWSIGGVLALGLARRLRDVRFVGLIDSVTPDEIDDADIALSFAAERWLDEQGRLLEHYARVSGMSALERESWVESMFGGDALEVFRTYRSNFDVLRGLTFSTYDGRVVLFRAEEQARVHDPSRWKALLGVVPAIRTVPGNHFTVLRPPAVSLLAGAIALEVERAFGSDGIP